MKQESLLSRASTFAEIRGGQQDAMDELKHIFAEEKEESDLFG
jgi:hypothetical protein